MARVDVTSWLKSQVSSLRKAHGDTATAFKNLITGQTVSLSAGTWAPAAQGIQAPPAGAAGWFQVTAAGGWSWISGAAKPAIRLLPGNRVMFAGALSGGTTTNNTQVLSTLPSWAWPQNAGCRIAVSTQGGANGGYLTISLAGIVACQGLASATTSFGWAVTYPLDNPAAP